MKIVFKPKKSYYFNFIIYIDEGFKRFHRYITIFIQKFLHMRLLLKSKNCQLFLTRFSSTPNTKLISNQKTKLRGKGHPTTEKLHVGTLTNIILGIHLESVLTNKFSVTGRIRRIYRQRINLSL